MQYMHVIGTFLIENSYNKPQEICARNFLFFVSTFPEHQDLLINPMISSVNISHEIASTWKHRITNKAQYLENKLIEFHQIALILTRSRFGLLHIIFQTFVIELWPFIDVRIFLLNILRTK